jgi:hypothetical protein
MAAVATWVVSGRVGERPDGGHRVVGIEWWLPMVAAVDGPERWPRRRA